MAAILKLVDYLWNIRFIKGYRSLIARAFLVLVSGYQALASVKAIHEVVPLPIIPMEVYAAITTYFGLKLEQFAKEHV